MNQPPNPRSVVPQILVVAGPGRSGTSLFAGLVSRLGLYLPKPEVIANTSNPRGFSEPRWLVDFHNELLRSVDVAVDDGRPSAWDRTAKVATRPRAQRRLASWLEEQFAESDRIVLKDPRMAWFFELYRAVAGDLGADLKVATMLRDPAEVIKSREIAYGNRTGPTTRIAGWLNGVLTTESLTRDLPRAVVRYDALLADWNGALAQADSTIGMGLLERASADQVEQADALVDTSLKRSVTDWSEMELPARLHDLTLRTYEALQRIVGVSPSDQAAGRAELDELRSQYVGYYTESEQVTLSSIRAARANERRRINKAAAAEEASDEGPLASTLRARAAEVLRKVRR